MLPGLPWRQRLAKSIEPFDHGVAYDQGSSAGHRNARGLHITGHLIRRDPCPTFTTISSRSSSKDFAVSFQKQSHARSELAT